MSLKRHDAEQFQLHLTNTMNPPVPITVSMDETETISMDETETIPMDETETIPVDETETEPMTGPGVTTALSVLQPVPVPVPVPQLTMTLETTTPNDDDPKKSDGGEPTPPSREEEPIAKSERLADGDPTPAAANVTPEKVRDIFDDLAALARTPEELIQSEKILANLPLRKPKNDEWIRTHEEIHAVVNFYESSTKNSYLVLPAALDALEQVVKSVRLTLAVTYAGDPFVWPVSVPSVRKPVACHITATNAAETAKRKWLRIGWDPSKMDYDVRGRGTGKTPEWPSEITNASEMLRFVSKTGGFEVIDSPNHPVVQELLGLS